MDLHTLADTAISTAHAAVLLHRPLLAIAVLTIIGLALDSAGRRAAVGGAR